MSFDHWWFSCLLAAEDEERFQPMYAQAEKKAMLSEEGQEGLRYWRAHPERFSWKWEHSASMEERQQHGGGYNRFVWAFNLPGFEKVGLEIAQFLSDETCFRFIIIRRCTPGAILWHALGEERALRLPGKMGNVFLRSTEVPQALAQTEEAMKGLDLAEAVNRGLALAEHSNDEADVRNVLSHYPDGLRRALELKKGFMSCARAQL